MANNYRKHASLFNSSSAPAATPRTALRQNRSTVRKPPVVTSQRTTTPQPSMPVKMAVDLSDLADPIVFGTLAAMGLVKAAASGTLDTLRANRLGNQKLMDQRAQQRQQGPAQDALRNQELSGQVGLGMARSNRQALQGSNLGGMRGQSAGGALTGRMGANTAVPPQQAVRNINAPDNSRANAYAAYRTPSSPLAEPTEMVVPGNKTNVFNQGKITAMDPMGAMSPEQQGTYGGLKTDAGRRAFRTSVMKGMPAWKGYVGSARKELDAAKGGPSQWAGAKSTGAMMGIQPSPGLVAKTKAPVAPTDETADMITNTPAPASTPSKPKGTTVKPTHAVASAPVKPVVKPAPAPLATDMSRYKPRDPELMNMLSGKTQAGQTLQQTATPGPELAEQFALNSGLKKPTGTMVAAKGVPASGKYNNPFQTTMPGQTPAGPAQTAFRPTGTPPPKSEAATMLPSEQSDEAQILQKTSPAMMARGTVPSPQITDEIFGQSDRFNRQSSPGSPEVTEQNNPRAWASLQNVGGLAEMHNKSRGLDPYGNKPGSPFASEPAGGAQPQALTSMPAYRPYQPPAPTQQPAAPSMAMNIPAPGANNYRPFNTTPMAQNRAISQFGNMGQMLQPSASPKAMAGAPMNSFKFGPPSPAGGSAPAGGLPGSAIARFNQAKPAQVKAQPPKLPPAV